MNCTKFALLLLIICTIANGATILDLPADPTQTTAAIHFSPIYTNQINILGHGIDIGEISTPNDSVTGKWYSIKSAASDLVIEVTEDKKLKVEYFNNKSQQLWKFETVDKPGIYYIISKHTRNVLEVKSGTLALVVNEKNGFSNQKWVINYDGRIYNIGTKHILDIKNADFSAGNIVQVIGSFNGNSANEFTLQEQLREEVKQ